MSQQIEFDSSRMDNMIRELQKRTGMTFRQVVRGITAAAITNTAVKTKQASPKMVDRRMSRIKASGFNTKSGANITITRSNKVWYRGAGWDKKSYILLNMQGKVTNVKGKGFRTRGGNPIGGVKISPRLRGQINRDLAELRSWASSQRKYLRGQIGAGKASFLLMLSQLGLKPTSTRGLKKAMAVKLPSKHKATVKTFQRGDREQFQVNLMSVSTAALNPRAGGIRAFDQALKGQVRAFEIASQKDITEYARRFASKNNILVKG